MPPTTTTCCASEGNDLTHIITGRATFRPMAPPEEVLARFPELAIRG